MRPALLPAVIAAVLAAGALFVSHARPLEPTEARLPPEFTQTRAEDWINSAPLRWSDLKGKVVLLDFWTFACYNCYRSFPWLRAVEERLGPRGLQVIGVHTPEFDHEKVKANVVGKVKEYQLTHPIMIDNAFTYWRAIGNEYWPAFYIIDKRGLIRGLFVGETHPGDRNARAIEGLIEQLLAEEM